MTLHLAILWAWPVCRSSVPAPISNSCYASRMLFRAAAVTVLECSFPLKAARTLLPDSTTPTSRNPTKSFSLDRTRNIGGFLGILHTRVIIVAVIIIVVISMWVFLQRRQCPTCYLLGILLLEVYRSSQLSPDVTDRRASQLTVVLHCACSKPHYNQVLWKRRVPPQGLL